MTEDQYDRITKMLNGIRNQNIHIANKLIDIENKIENLTKSDQTELLHKAIDDLAKEINDLKN